MPAWIQITADRLVDILTPAELELLRRLSPDAFDDTVGRRVASVVAQVRSRVGSRPGNRLSADAALIPPELEAQALTLIAAALRSSPSIALPLSQDQRDQVAAARKDLDSVAAGTYLVSMPDEPEPAPTTQGPGASQLVQMDEGPFAPAAVQGLL